MGMIGLLLVLAIECPLTVTSPVEVYARVYYLHEKAHQHYVHTTFTVAVSDATVRITPEGNAIGVTWHVRYHDSDGGFRLEKICGEVPSAIYPLIFLDGVETGTTERWARTAGGEG